MCCPMRDRPCMAVQGSGKGSKGTTPKKFGAGAKHGSIACLEELEAVGKAQTKKQMEWASGRYAAR